MWLQLTPTSLGMRLTYEEGKFEEEQEGRWPILPSSAEDAPLLLNWDVTLNTVSPGRPYKKIKKKIKKSAEAQIWAHTPDLRKFGFASIFKTRLLHPVEEMWYYIWYKHPLHFVVRISLCASTLNLLKCSRII